jgi:hypothetical protein
MNPLKHLSTCHDDRQLDLLVDDELSEAERRDLLLRLQQEPDGWRRCALAFLEAQSWRRAVRAAATKAAEMRTAETAPAPPSVARLPPPFRRAFLGKLRTVLAMAATFLVAVGLGMWLGWLQHGSRLFPIAQNGSGGPKGIEQSPPPEVVRLTDEGHLGPWRTVQVALPGEVDGDAEMVDLPARECESLDARWLDNLPAAIPPAVVQALQEYGFQVWQQRNLLPLRTQDGRPLLVPVERVEVRYVGNQTY